MSSTSSGHAPARWQPAACLTVTPVLALFASSYGTEVVFRVFLFGLPFVALFAASVMFAIALMARSSKEAQTYLMPLVFVVIFPALLGGLPGLEVSPALYLIPIFNTSQIIHGILLGDVSMVNYGITLAANLTYAGIAFVLATRMFQDERVLFRS